MKASCSQALLEKVCLTFIFEQKGQEKIKTKQTIFVVYKNKFQHSSFQKIKSIM